MILIDNVKRKQLIVRVLVTVSVSIMETILVDAFSGKIYFHFRSSFSKNGDTVCEYFKQTISQQSTSNFARYFRTTVIQSANYKNKTVSPLFTHA